MVCGHGVFLVYVTKECLQKNIDCIPKDTIEVAKTLKLLGNYRQIAYISMARNELEIVMRSSAVCVEKCPQPVTAHVRYQSFQNTHTTAWWAVSHCAGVVPD